MVFPFQVKVGFPALGMILAQRYRKVQYQTESQIVVPETEPIYRDS